MTKRKSKRHTTAKVAKPKRYTSRSDSKQAQVIALLRRPKGATIDEMAVATGWQHHSVRGVISGALKKRLGLTIASNKEERGRVYRITDAGANAQA